MIEKMQSIYDRATNKQIIFYGSAEGFGFNTINIFVMMFFLYYVTTVCKVPVAFAGLIITIARFFDAITDPIMGMLADRTNTKWGRFRPYILLGSILFSASVILMFWGPAIESKGIYLMGFYMLNSVGVTLLSVSVNSTRGIITQEPVQRVRLAIPASIATVFAMAIVMIGTVPFTQHFGDSISAWRNWAIIISLLSFLAWRVFDYSIREKDVPQRYSGARKEKVTLKEQLIILKLNRPLQMLIIASATNDFATGFSSALQIFFWTYVVRRIDLQPISSAIMLPAMVLMSIVVGQLAKKYSKKQIFVAGSWSGIVVPAIMLILQPFDQPMLVLVLMALSIITTPLTGNTRWPMMADCIDYSEWITGKNSAGVISSIYTLFNKLGNSIPAVIAGSILAALGFIEGADMQNRAVLQGIIWLSFGGAIFGHICSLVAMKFYTITRELYEKMVTEMKDRKVKITEKERSLN